MHSRRDQIIEKFGAPVKSESWYDRFVINDSVSMSLLCYESLCKISTISFGWRPVFSDSSKGRDRVSPIFDSVTVE